MPLNWPLNPSLEQAYTEAGKTWIWNGYAWDSGTALGKPSGDYLPLTGGTVTGNLYVSDLNVSGSSEGIPNIYNSDGTLLGNRTLRLGDYLLKITDEGDNSGFVFYPKNDFSFYDEGNLTLAIGKSGYSKYNLDLSTYSNINIDGGNSIFYSKGNGISNFKIGAYPNYNLDTYGPGFPNQQTQALGYNFAFYDNHFNIGHVNSAAYYNVFFGGMRSKMVIGFHPTYFHGLAITPEWLKDVTDNQNPSTLQLASVANRPLGGNTTTLWLKHYGNNASSPGILFEKDRTPSENWLYGTNNANVQASDNILAITTRACFYDSPTSAGISGRAFGGQILCSVENVTVSPGFYRMAANLRFLTTDGSNGLPIERLRIVGTSGNLLVNTTTDSGYKFDVNGSVRSQGNLYFGVGGSYLFGDTNNIRIYDKNNSVILQSFPNGVSSSETCLKSSSGDKALRLNDNSISLEWANGNTSESTQNPIQIIRGFFGNVSATDKSVLTVKSNSFSDLTNATVLRGVYIDINDTTTYTGFTTVRAIEAPKGGAYFNTTSPNSSAILQADSTTQGFLPPRMTGSQAELISSPAEGLMIYSTDGSGSIITSKGWWGFEGTTWVKLN